MKETEILKGEGSGKMKKKDKIQQDSRDDSCGGKRVCFGKGWQ